MGLIEQCSQLFGSLVSWLVEVIGHMGYSGIIGLMFLESSFSHSQVKLSYLRQDILHGKGDMNLFLVIISGITGSVLGGLFNYWIAVKWGRPIFEKYGKCFFNHS